MAKQPKTATEPNLEKALDHIMNPRERIGGNNPPSQIELLTETHKPLADRLAKLREEATALPTVIKTDEHLTAVTAVVLKTRALSKDERTAFESEKKPLREAAKAVDTFFNSTFKDKIEEIDARLQRRLDIYAEEQDAKERARAAEAQRKADAEAERQRKLAEKHENTGRAAQHETRAEVAESHAQEAGAAANAPVADLTRKRVDGATFSGSAVWSGEITDFAAMQASLGPLGVYLKLKEIEDAIARMAKATEDRVALPGVKFSKSISANVRKR